MKGRLFLVCFGSFVHNYLLCLEKRKKIIRAYWFCLVDFVS